VFGYYLWDVKRKPNDKSKRPRNVAWIVAAVVIAGVVAGFFIVGSPAEQRDRRLDEQRVEDLQMIQSQIINYWNKKGSLPDTLEEMEDDIFGFVLPSDPETEEPYEYHILSDLTFDLCAEFKTKTRETFRGEFQPREKMIEQSWAHDAGTVCFERKIDPELHKIEDGIIPLERIGF
jgi:hypothetical protein